MSKRTAEHQLSKEEEDEEPYNPEEYVGPFQKADESELATRRIVKVKRRNKPKEKSDEDTMTSTSNVGFLWDFSKTSSQQSESSGFENAWKPPDFTSGFGANLNKEASKPTLFSFNFATGTEESKTEDQTQLINDLRRENEELKEKVKKLLEENKRLGGSASTTGNISPTTTAITTKWMVVTLSSPQRTRCHSILFVTIFAMSRNLKRNPNGVWQVKEYSEWF
jgi:hypothetical protein